MSGYDAARVACVLEAMAAQLATLAHEIRAANGLQMQLSPRAAGVCKALGVADPYSREGLAALSSFTDGQIFRVPSAGRKTVAEIKRFVALQGS